jgi:kynurenine aminotransferase
MLDIPEDELEKGIELEALFCQGNVVPERSRDWKVCRWLTTQIGVAAIPPSEFYGPENKHLANDMIRFCFCKTDETLFEARKRLMNLKPFVKS